MTGRMSVDNSHGMTATTLDPGRLMVRCKPGDLPFDTTAELDDPDQAFGQGQAVQALRFGLDVSGPGYSAFVMGRQGSGRHGIVRRILSDEAARRPVPPDWCYIYNFEQVNKPRALSLPAGEGTRLRDRMHSFVGEVGMAIEAAFDSDEYRARIAAIQKDFQVRQETALQTLGDKAMAQGVALVHTPQGIVFTPLKDGQPMSDDQVASLSDADRERLKQVVAQLGDDLRQWARDLPRLRREMRGQIRHASRDAMALAASHLIDELKEDFSALPQVIAFLDEVLRDVIEAGESLREQTGDENEMGRFRGTLSVMRYEVNLIVGHERDGHAPICYCDNPTYPKLVGRVDQMAHLGTLITNFTLIKAGALHEANGGYLLLDAVQVLMQPQAWEGLKRALRKGHVDIETLPQLLGWTSALPLEPEPIPLQLRVVLFGEREHYHLLKALDPDFADLFKVAIDFEDVAPRDPWHTLELARLFGRLAREQGLRPLTRTAAARMVEHASRLAGDARKLSTCLRPLNDLMREADALAIRAGRTTIEHQDVCAALDAAVRRLNRLQRQVQDATLREMLLIGTQGEQLGAVNGLAVTELGEFCFGHPVRITATARVGDGELVDILRESHLGQPLHAKGVLILAALLGARYSKGQPLSLRASLVFEQTYGPIDGDSASLAELCALLSVLAGAPVNQSLAVTGSVNQLGQVQPVGAVNEKIEGFFDLCHARGLTGEQGVLIPLGNVQHLMLREDVVNAVARGCFYIHAVSDVDDAMELLTGLPAVSVNHLVTKTLAQFSMARQAWSTGAASQQIKRWPRRPSGRRFGKD